MVKNFFILLLTGFFVLTVAVKPAFADKVTPPNSCDPKKDTCESLNGNTYSCLPAKNPPPDFFCQKDVLGKIQPPSLIAEFLKNERTGAGAISQFLTNFITLLFGIAAIALIFMIIWGAFDWTTSGGDKEKLASAQKRIINAIIGILLFAVAFAGIRVLGRFTGFTLFRGQNYTVTDRDAQGRITGFRCIGYNGGKYGGTYTPDEIDEYCR